MALGAGSAIGEILPHRSSMLLLDRVVLAEGDRVVGEWRVRAGSPWIDGGVLRRSALLEVAAQTAAAGASIATEGKGRGLLGAISDLEFLADARAGDAVVAHVDVLLRFERLVRVAFRVERVSADGEPVGTVVLLASGQMTLAVA